MTSINMASADGGDSTKETAPPAPLPPRSSMMEKQNSVTMEYFLETSNLDATTAQLLRNYDKDGNGSFSKDEVVAIILDLRETMKRNENLGNYNKLFKRLLIAACIFCVLLLASMFGLSYAVAALTVNTKVDSDTGALVAAGAGSRSSSSSGQTSTTTTTVVSVNSRAEIHPLPETGPGYYCITWDEVDIIRLEITNGRNVILDQTTLDGEEMITKLSGGSVIVDEDQTCFTTSIGEIKCVVSSPLCAEHEARRRLSPEERVSLGLPAESPYHNRRRSLQGGGGGGCVGCQQSDGSTSWKACFDATGNAVKDQLWLTNDYGCGCQSDVWCNPGLVCGAATEALCNP